jgi:hypothetical protein
MKICCRQTPVREGWEEKKKNAKYRRQQGVLFGADGNTAWPDMTTTTERKEKYVILYAKHNSVVRVEHKSEPPAPRVTAVVMIAFFPKFSAEQ